MEKNFSKEQIISYLEKDDQEIKEAAFGYIIRNIIKNDTPMFQMSEVLLYKEKLSEKAAAEIIIHIGISLKEESVIKRFIQMSYWFYEQPLYISKILNDNHNAYFEQRGLEILFKIAQQAHIPEACYQYLMMKAICGDNKCLNILLKMLQHHPNTEIEFLLKIAQHKNWPSIPLVLTKIIQQDKNEKNFTSVLRFIDCALKEKLFEIDALNNLFILTIKNYNKTSKVSHETFNFITSLCDGLKVNDNDLKQIAQHLMYFVSNDNPLIREKKINLLKKVVEQTKDYLFVLKLLTMCYQDTLLKRVVILSVYSLMGKLSQKFGKEDTTYLEYKKFVLQFIKIQGPKFDKSDFEYIYGILNLNKDDKSYIQTIATELANNCQKNPIQIDCLLRLAINYNQYIENLLELINWQNCPIDASILYHLSYNYKNTKKEIYRKAYLQIFSQLAIRPNFSLDLEILLGEILIKMNLFAKKQIEYPNIQNKIKWYKERQQLLEMLNN